MARKGSRDPFGLAPIAAAGSSDVSSDEMDVQANFVDLEDMVSEGGERGSDLLAGREKDSCEEQEFCLEHEQAAVDGDCQTGAWSGN